jgi:tetratricopeptide (TPR) repeat protein
MTKGIFIFSVFSFLYIISSAQSFFDNYQKYFKAGDYINAKKEIESAIAIPANANNSKAWLYRSEVNAILFSNKPNENQGSLEIAYMSIMKASSLDSKNELTKDIANQIKLLSTLYYNKGSNDFNNQKYTYALLSLERAAEIGNLLTPSVTNPDIYYYIATAAQLSNNTTKAKKYFSMIVDQKTTKPDAYTYLADIYKNEKNNSAAIEVYKKGINTLSNNSQQLYVNIVKLYLNIGFTNDAIVYLNKGIAQYPNHEDLNYIKAGLNSQLNENSQAMEGYKKTIELNPNHLEANYNLGIMYYNSSINHLKTADSYLNTNTQKYESEKDIFINEIKKAMPLLEKAHKLDGSNKNTVLCLLDVYKRMQRKDQYNALKLELDKMK